MTAESNLDQRTRRLVSSCKIVVIRIYLTQIEIEIRNVEIQSEFSNDVNFTIKATAETIDFYNQSWI